jgi:hypothetical protein
VIYRELFPFGLTIADLSSTVRPVAVSLSHVAARQELRAILQALGLDGFAAAARAREAKTLAAKLQPDPDAVDIDAHRHAAAAPTDAAREDVPA